MDTSKGFRPTVRALRVIEEGKKARREGKPISENPYHYTSQGSATAMAGWWDKGWQEADSES